MVDRVELIDWLLEHGGPVIRYRTAKELMYCDEVPQSLQDDLLASPLTDRWLENLRPELGFNQLHGAAPTTFESAMGKLTQLGFRAGMPYLDQRIELFSEWFSEHAGMPVGETYSWTPFKLMLMAPFLARAGYYQESSLQQYALHRLDTLYNFTRKGKYDLFVDPAKYTGIPKAFRGQTLVDPALTAGGVYHFPLIYDIHLLANFSQDLINADTRKKIETVVTYILHPDYQSLPEGYGIMQTGPRKFYAVGWSVHLPGYSRNLEEDRWQHSFVQRMVLLSQFPIARQHCWFREGLEYLKQFRTDAGIYSFPRPLLQEKRYGYWVMGSYMGLEDNRRTKKALELESTFWMLKITDRSTK